jgi:hypothetical protein
VGPGWVTPALAGAAATGSSAEASGGRGAGVVSADGVARFIIAAGLAGVRDAIGRARLTVAGRTVLASSLAASVVCRCVVRSVDARSASDTLGETGGDCNATIGAVSVVAGVNKQTPTAVAAMTPQKAKTRWMIVPNRLFPPLVGDEESDFPAAAATRAHRSAPTRVVLALSPAMHSCAQATSP